MKKIIFSMMFFLAWVLTQVGTTDEVVEATQESLQAKIDLKGILTAFTANEVQLDTKEYSGKLIVREAVPEGQLVKKGEILLWLEPEEIEKEIKKTRLDLEEAKAKEAQAEAELKLEEKGYLLNLQKAREAKEEAGEALRVFKEVDRALSARSAEIGIWWVELSIQNIKDELDQLLKMYKEDNLTEETEELVIKRTRRRLEISMENLKVLQQEYELLVKSKLPRKLKNLTMDFDLKAAALEKLEAMATIQKQAQELGLEKARARVNEIEGKLAALSSDQRLCLCESPQDGITCYGRLNQGQWVDMDKSRDVLKRGTSIPRKQVLYTIIDPSLLDVIVSVPENYFYLLKEGMEANIRPVGLPTLLFRAKLRKISPVCRAEQKTFEIRFSFEKGDTTILPGMSAMVELEVKREGAITLPCASISREGDKSYCRVLSGSETVKRMVQTGLIHEDRIEILSGVQVGEKVALPKKVKERKTKRNK